MDIFHIGVLHWYHIARRNHVIPTFWLAEINISATTDIYKITIDQNLSGNIANIHQSLQLE